MDNLLAQLDVLSDHQVERVLIEKIHALARRHQFKIDTIAMKIDYPVYLRDAYRAEQFNQIKTILLNTAFWWISISNEKQTMLYDCKQKLLWNAKPDADAALLENDAQRTVAQYNLGALNNWRLPSRNELVFFGTYQSNLLSLCIKK
ncbi:hypothetical protein CKO09_10635 [Chromatium weissei]|nr:hypothetical protein [Chromatium weissei]